MSAYWAVILGASEGTGAAISKAVARNHGFNIFGMHRGNHNEQAEQVVRDIGAANCRAVMRVGDAGSAEGAMWGTDELLAAAGPRSVRLFVHAIANASLGRFVAGPGETLVPRQFQKSIESMANSFVYWAQALAERDLLAPSARLLALGNPLRESLLHSCGLVAAAKAALEMYVRHLAFELGPKGVRVNLLNFPTVITPAVKKVYSKHSVERLEALHRSIIPARRMCSLEEVARFVCVLAGDDAEWFNGATIDFTGGMAQSLLDKVLNGRQDIGDEDALAQ